MQYILFILLNNIFQNHYECCVTGRVKHVAILPVRYRSVATWLAGMVRRPGYYDLMQRHWKDSQLPVGFYRDVYDGQMWRSLNSRLGIPFLRPQRLGPDDTRRDTQGFPLSLNADWMKVFKSVEYSVGIFYLVNLLLPIEERYLRRNICILVVIPGGTEANLSVGGMNHLLRPVVNEIVDIYQNGRRVEIVAAPAPSNSSVRHHGSSSSSGSSSSGASSAGSGGNVREGQRVGYSRIVTLHATIVLVVCDGQARRPTCGFLGNAAYMACMKCKQRFPRELSERNPTRSDGRPNEQPNFTTSGVDARLRTHEEHISDGKSWLAQRTLEARAVEATRTGARYCVLGKVPGLDLVKGAAQDRMHWLHLGMGKKYFVKLRERGILNNRALSRLQAFLDCSRPPNDIGRIRRKFVSMKEGTFGHVKAAEWKNLWIIWVPWILPGLEGMTEDDNKLVLALSAAFRLTEQSILRQQDVEGLDRLFLRVLELFEKVHEVYDLAITTHELKHFASEIPWNGHPQSWDCYAFERHNRLVGNIPRNVSSIELCVMNALTEETTLQDAPVHMGGHLDLHNEEIEIFESLVPGPQHNNVRCESPETDPLSGGTLRGPLLQWAVASARQVPKYEDEADFGWILHGWEDVPIESRGYMWKKAELCMRQRKGAGAQRGAASARSVPNLVDSLARCLQTACNVKLDWKQTISCQYCDQSSEVCVAGELYSSMRSRTMRASTVGVYFRGSTQEQEGLVELYLGVPDFYFKAIVRDKKLKDTIERRAETEGVPPLKDADGNVVLHYAAMRWFDADFTTVRRSGKSVRATKPPMEEWINPISEQRIKMVDYHLHRELGESAVRVHEAFRYVWLDSFEWDHAAELSVVPVIALAGRVMPVFTDGDPASDIWVPGTTGRPFRGILFPKKVQL